LLEALFSMMHISNYKFEQLSNIFDYINSYNIKIDNKIIGTGGQVNNILFTEIDLDSILGKSSSIKAKLWPKYPPQIEDVSLIFPDKTYIGEVKGLIKKQNDISDVELKDTFKDSYTFRIWYQNPNKTLTDQEVKSIREKMLKEIKEKFGATEKN
jgi:phenylalanyl-tRNA synthetase beta subunit